MNRKKDKMVSGALAFITLMGIVSLFSDMTHEGARSILGEYLNLTGASATTIGFVSGIGELCGERSRHRQGLCISGVLRPAWRLFRAGHAVCYQPD